MSLLGLHHDPVLLLIAACVCLTGCVGVFRIRWRMEGVRGAARDVWTFLAAVEAGGAVWGAQTLALLAAAPPVALGFDPLRAVGALAVAVVGSHLALAMGWSGGERLRRAVGGAVLALTAGAVHFAVLGAQVMQAELAWEPIAVWGAGVAAVGLCAAALLAAGRPRKLRSQLLAAGLMALAVLGLHFASMGAAQLRPDPALPLPAGLLDRTAMLLLVGLFSFIMIAVGLGAAYLDDSASRRALQRLQQLADATRDGIAVLSADHRVLECNAAVCGLCGLSGEEMRGRSLWEFVSLDGGAEPRLDQRQEGQVRTAEGGAGPVAVRLSPVAELGADGRPGLVATVSDLREQRAAEARIRFLADHDLLTGLPNRAALARALQPALDAVRVDGESRLVLVEVQVVNSQELNSLHGYGAGDALLAKVGERVRRLAGDPARAARLGGNAFAFFFSAPDLPDDGAAARLFFARATAVLRRPFVWNALPIEPQVRLGVAASPQDSATVDDLMAHAGSALRAPDDEGHDGVFYFRKELHEALNAQRALAGDLRRAIADDGLDVVYQPQARAEDGALCGFEALVRWRHPVQGPLPPDRFIGVAEQSGLIGALGERVLRRACADAVRWPRPVTVAVNLSPLQVNQPDLPARVHEILLETGLPPHRLELEITETALFRDHQGALDTLRRLKGLGIRIAMDDFGTGFSSLSTLQSFPFDKIKIDKGFVQGVGLLERSTVIVKAVLGIGRGLAVPVVAEGVETPEQMAFLRDERCGAVQGYLIGKPGPIEQHGHLFASVPEPAPRRRRAA